MFYFCVRYYTRLSSNAFKLWWDFFLVTVTNLLPNLTVKEQWKCFGSWQSYDWDCFKFYFLLVTLYYCSCCFFGWLLQVDVIKWVSNVRTSVRPSVRPQKVSLISTKFGVVGRGRRVSHDGMQYDPIQGQGQGHEPLKAGNWAIFKDYLLPHL